ncbi:RES family NAD+ phosphorylase [Nocardioides baekrokdamisoli]|uniref:RES family NAD+ phosphorylase n=1 Tax=Nocardioides baekrokdamisoli TaxID=1804624 RepID=UPI000F779BD3|nr:RES family NAD+ phosphorylase [Nocardioides baekrokdamisoli]
MPFRPVEEQMGAGAPVFRVYRSHRSAIEFNPNGSTASRARFSPFGDPSVPTLYAASSETCAVSESLFHDVPILGGPLRPGAYLSAVMGLIRPTRDLNLAALHGFASRRLGIDTTEVRTAEPNEYAQTATWGEAAHAAGFDGMVWMSKRYDSEKAYVFFGDRCADAFEQDNSFARAFALSADLEWLIDLAAPLRIDVLI